MILRRRSADNPGRSDEEQQESLIGIRDEIAELRQRLLQLIELSDERKHDDESRWSRLFEELRLDRDAAEIQWETLRRELDDRDSAREALTKMRLSERYAAAFDDPEPLITVRIASYRRTKELIEIALASVLRQSYERFEVIVVNDGPNDETRAAVAALGDDRIRYEELPERQSYPRHPHLRWMVAGSPGMNRAVELARGTWIAPLDDDDEFERDHLERLLNLAREERAELSYGAVRRIDVATGVAHRVFSSPPAISEFSFQGALYLAALSFMSYQTDSWRIREPGDWNLIRRMTDVGVRFAATTEYVSTTYSVSYDDREQT